MNRHVLSLAAMTITIASCTSSRSNLETRILEQVNEMLEGTFVYATDVKLDSRDDNHYSGSITFEIDGKEQNCPVELTREGDSLQFDIPDFE